MILYVVSKHVVIEFIIYGKRHEYCRVNMHKQHIDSSFSRNIFTGNKPLTVRVLQCTKINPYRVK